ncbi:MAG TPA: hypothetical protein VIO57_06290 [Chloroflexota bacterium]
MQVPPQEKVLLDPIPSAARVSLGDVRFEAAWRHGRAMSTDEAIALALSVVP